MLLLNINFGIIIHKVINLLRVVIFTPVSWINYLIPKNKDIWVFGEFIGLGYSDNARYLFEYVNNNHKDVRAIWLTRSAPIFKQLKSSNYEVFYTYSFKGFIFSAIAKNKIVTACPSDVNRFTCSRSNIINLWHGTPLKKIGLDNSHYQRKSIKKSKLWSILCLFIPTLEEVYTHVIIPSDTVSSSISSALRISNNSTIITGYPRTDIFKDSVHLKLKEKKTIFYLPTYRENYTYDYFLGLNIKEFDIFLRKRNMIFYYKLHPLDKNDLSVATDNIIPLSPDFDLYRFLRNTDILLTDYSSVFFDFLLTNNPIIFTPFDLDRYKKERELYYDYNKITPGPKCSNWSSVIDNIENIIVGNDLYKTERREICKKFNKYDDFKSSERVYKFIKNL